VQRVEVAAYSSQCVRVAAGTPVSRLASSRYCSAVSVFVIAVSPSTSS
jgi:hypothetical protein